MKYDKKFLMDAASRLEWEARFIVFTTAARYIAATFAGSFVLAAILNYVDPKDFQLPLVPASGFFAVIGLIFGISKGRQLAFDLRVRVHTLLALVKIEENTHQDGEATKIAVA